MNDYIINPMWFYWLQVASDLSIGIFVVGVVVALFAGGGLIIAALDGGHEAKEKKKLFKAIVIGCIFCFVSMFIPTKDTLIEMEIAKTATYNNVESAIETVKSVTDYVIEKIGELKK